MIPYRCVLFILFSMLTKMALSTLSGDLFRENKTNAGNYIAGEPPKHSVKSRKTKTARHRSRYVPPSTTAAKIVNKDRQAWWTRRILELQESTARTIGG